MKTYLLTKNDRYLTLSLLNDVHLDCYNNYGTILHYQAEAIRYFNYPYPAIEEALVNAR